MIFSAPNWPEYVSGKKFSNGFRFKPVADAADKPGRLDHLEDICRGKRVIHFGFADHVPLVPEKIRQNKWLHKRLQTVADTVVGLDIDADAVGYCRTELGIDGVYAFDLFKDDLPAEVANSHWDLVIMGEILEHVDNPVEFLQSMHRVFGPVAEKLVVTVPNALCSLNISESLKGNEYINTDHRYWFSPFTLVKVAYRAGFEVDKLTYCSAPMPRRSLRRLLERRNPILRENLIGLFSFQ